MRCRACGLEFTVAQMLSYCVVRLIPGNKLVACIPQAAPASDAKATLAGMLAASGAAGEEPMAIDEPAAASVAAAEGAPSSVGRTTHSAAASTKDGAVVSEVRRLHSRMALAGGREASAKAGDNCVAASPSVAGGGSTIGAGRSAAVGDGRPPRAEPSSRPAASADERLAAAAATATVGAAPASSSQMAQIDGRGDACRGDSATNGLEGLLTDDTTAAEEVRLLPAPGHHTPALVTTI